MVNSDPELNCFPRCSASFGPSGTVHHMALAVVQVVASVARVALVVELRNATEMGSEWQFG
jgi:hypothetical protein